MRPTLLTGALLLLQCPSLLTALPGVGIIKDYGDVNTEGLNVSTEEGHWVTRSLHRRATSQDQTELAGLGHKRTISAVSKDSGSGQGSPPQQRPRKGSTASDGSQNSKSSQRTTTSGSSVTRGTASSPPNTANHIDPAEFIQLYNTQFLTQFMPQNSKNFGVFQKAVQDGVKLMAELFLAVSQAKSHPGGGTSPGGGTAAKFDASYIADTLRKTTLDSDDNPTINMEFYPITEIMDQIRQLAHLDSSKPRVQKMHTIEQDPVWKIHPIKSKALPAEKPDLHDDTLIMATSKQNKIAIVHKTFNVNDKTPEGAGRMYSSDLIWNVLNGDFKTKVHQLKIVLQANVVSTITPVMDELLQRQEWDYSEAFGATLKDAIPLNRVVFFAFLGSDNGRPLLRMLKQRMGQIVQAQMQDQVRKDFGLVIKQVAWALDTNDYDEVPNLGFVLGRPTGDETQLYLQLAELLNLRPASPTLEQVPSSNRATTPPPPPQGGRKSPVQPGRVKARRG
ncbi:hypothetical protein EX30DRAFT_365518 [Ascodesmis nigricans]|uniref:Uncharacterized protein n=1 Tax=Ascodesmis nigricans TaxID=341454 RepID=A0A4S2MSL7_9PEZI|nr:hypothetical protein EX30DRAFT_365518 [Ascodesmis nigricans]